MGKEATAPADCTASEGRGVSESGDAGRDEGALAPFLFHYSLTYPRFFANPFHEVNVKLT